MIVLFVCKGRLSHHDCFVCLGGLSHSRPPQMLGVWLPSIPPFWSSGDHILLLFFWSKLLEIHLGCCIFFFYLKRGGGLFPLLLIKRWLLFRTQAERLKTPANAQRTVQVKHLTPYHTKSSYIMYHKITVHCTGDQMVTKCFQHPFQSCHIMYHNMKSHVPLPRSWR